MGQLRPVPNRRHARVHAASEGLLTQRDASPPEPSDLRAQLLARTLAYAASEVPYYRRDARLQRKGTRLSLDDFPIVDRDLIASHTSEFLVLDRFPDYVVSSGGTTRGVPNISFRNAEEYEAAHEYLTGYGPGEAPPLDSIEEFTLDLFFNTNGYHWRKPRGWPVVSIALEQPAHADLVRTLIEEGLDLGNRRIPCRRVQSQNGPLRTLTGWLWVNEFAPAASGIDSVYVYGSHLSRVWRERLREFWGARVVTSYGLMEFGVGGAFECTSCGGCHYRTAWPEFMALDGTGHVQRGDAALVLTSLIPFVHVQPRIRYRTDDLVTLLGHCAKTGYPSFRFRGRAESSVVVRDDAGSRIAFSEVDALEVIDQVSAAVNCRPHSSEAQLWADPFLPRPPFQMGFPRFEVRPEGSGGTTDRPRATLTIETVFDPKSDAARAAHLNTAIIDLLAEEAPAFATREIELDLKFVGPGGLRLRTKASA
jgi:hypothetical protein